MSDTAGIPSFGVTRYSPWRDAIGVSLHHFNGVEDQLGDLPFGPLGIASGRGFEDDVVVLRLTSSTITMLVKREEPFEAQSLPDPIASAISSTSGWCLLSMRRTGSHPARVTIIDEGLLACSTDYAQDGLVYYVNANSLAVRLNEHGTPVPVAYVPDNIDPVACGGTGRGMWVADDEGRVAVWSDSALSWTQPEVQRAGEVVGCNVEGTRVFFAKHGLRRVVNKPFGIRRVIRFRFPFLDDSCVWGTVYDRDNDGVFVFGQDPVGTMYDVYYWSSSGEVIKLPNPLASKHVFPIVW